jgi:anti-sigma factor RsiW
MTHSTEPDFDPILIDLALGRLPAAEVEAVRQRLSHDPDLAQQHASLTEVFGVLNALSVPISAPDGLQDRIAARVAAARPLSVRHAQFGTEADDELAGSGGGLIVRIANLRDVIAVAAMLVLAVGLGIPGLLSVRDRSQRIACSANLGSTWLRLAAVCFDLCRQSALRRLEPAGQLASD